jgi:FixJ family two-component response regulator
MGIRLNFMRGTIRLRFLNPELTLGTNQHESPQCFLPEDSAMAKRKEKIQQVFLIVDDNDQRNELAKGLRNVGYDVHDYMTGREFLIDKPRHIGGVVVCEYRLHDMTGVELYERLAEERSAFPIVLITKRMDVSKVLSRNVAEFVVNPATIESVHDAIQRVTAGEVFTDAKLELAFKRLTPRELEVGELIVAGHTRHEIAELLKISMRTVEVHRRRLMENLRADDLGHLARLWRAWQGSGKNE